MGTIMETNAWLNPEIIAKKCPKEYLKWELESAKISKVFNYLELELYLEHDETLDEFNITEKNRNFIKNECNIKKCYYELIKSFREKTGLTLFMSCNQDDYDMSIVYRPKSLKHISISNLENRFYDNNTIQWLCRITDLKAIAEIDPVLVTVCI